MKKLFFHLHLVLIPLFVILVFASPVIGKILAFAETVTRFEGMFAETFLPTLVGGMLLQLAIIIILEGAAVIAAVISVINREFLPEKNKVFLRSSLILSAAAFFILAFGQQVLGNGDHFFKIFTYFVFTLFLLHIVPQEKKGFWPWQ
ncbi:hypothetical protein K9M59_03670 [Candidatus Gracilibacteria bacterium]|nr:hypothetical protein [Candidatus Gracilibacteria bacterium]MCF7819421.1 hypothetical protein [Candidatus Gracilibacteria bacterium]